MAKNLFEKIWEAHEVDKDLIYIDLHLVHEVTSAQAFDGLRLGDRQVRRPDKTLATADHNVPIDGTPGPRCLPAVLVLTYVPPGTAPPARPASTKGWSLSEWRGAVWNSVVP